MDTFQNKKLINRQQAATLQLVIGYTKKMKPKTQPKMSNLILCNSCHTQHPKTLMWDQDKCLNCHACWACNTFASNLKEFNFHLNNVLYANFQRVFNIASDHWKNQGEDNEWQDLMREIWSAFNLMNDHYDSIELCIPDEEQLPIFDDMPWNRCQTPFEGDTDTECPQAPKRKNLQDP